MIRFKKLLLISFFLTMHSIINPLRVNLKDERTRPTVRASQSSLSSSSSTRSGTWSSLVGTPILIKVEKGLDLSIKE